MRRWAVGLVLFGLCLGTSGFTSCAGTTGPLLAPLSITPRELLLRSSLSSLQEAIGLARIEGGEEGERFTTTISLVKDPGVAWLTVDLGGTDLTLRARPDGLAEGVYFADVTVQAQASGAKADLHVEFTVLR